MSKKISVLFCVLMFAALTLIPAAPAESSGPAAEAVYTAKTNLEFHLRPAPASERWVCTVPIHQRVEVLEYRPDWSLLRWKNAEGWAETRWLREFITLDPLHHALPDYTPCTGLWTFSRETFISAGQFSGLTLKEKTVVAVRREKNRPVLPVWRAETELDPASGEYLPFTPWNNAKSGEIIAGFTTFYNDAYGAPLAAERRHNIELGCRLLSGKIIAPGDSFSFNEVCGPYNKKTGYVTARNVSSSGYGTGGGVCQLSTTLYNALLQIPVQITDWAVHSISGVKYIPVAYDACVGNYSDMCFRNTLPYAVRLQADTQGGALTVLICPAE